MRDPHIVWEESTRPAVRDLYERILTFHLGLIPAWCQRLYIDYDAHLGDGAALQVAGHPEYRWARITVGPAALMSEPWHREEQFVHELYHLPLQPMHIVATDLRELAEESVPRKFLRECWRRAWEGAVCDLARAYMVVHRLHPEPENP